MIRTKLGLPSIATKTLALYASAILQANILEPPHPKAQWRKCMDRIAKASCEHYRSVVRHNAGFVAYFREATPENELGSLPISSRPSRRHADDSINSLRAMPWIFAWSQNRLMLPAWLGAAQAMQEVIDSGQGSVLRSMAEQWPFFTTRLSMLKMVFAKSDPTLSGYYDKRLVSHNHQAIGIELREQLEKDINTLLKLIESPQLLANDSWGLTSIGLRKIYLEPLNVL